MEMSSRREIARMCSNNITSSSVLSFALLFFLSRYRLSILLPEHCECFHLTSIRGVDMKNTAALKHNARPTEEERARENEQFYVLGANKMAAFDFHTQK